MRTEVTPPGSPVQRRATWVQTDRSAHEAWARLAMSNARAAAVLHTLVGHMQPGNNAVVASRATLARMLNVSEATIKRAVSDLRAGLWIEVVQLGGKGGVNAYVVNSRVAWAAPRDQLGRALFSATVIAMSDEQDSIGNEPLRHLPILRPGELAMPTGPGLPPPAQRNLDGLDPPALQLADDEDMDPTTGEIQKRLPGLPASPKRRGPAPASKPPRAKPAGRGKRRR